MVLVVMVIELLLLLLTILVMAVTAFSVPYAKDEEAVMGGYNCLIISIFLLFTHILSWVLSNYLPSINFSVMGVSK